jgi:hypothetical protein
LTIRTDVRYTQGVLAPALSLALPDDEKADVLVCLRESIDRMELEFAQLAAEFASGDHWDRAGYNSPGDWMRFNRHMTAHQAWSSITVGERQAELTQTVDAMRSGEVGFAHLAAMARTSEAVGKSFDESKLLGLARETSPGKFYFKCLHYRHSVDPQKYAAEQSDDEANHHLNLSTVESGHLLINGVLDPVGGAAVRSALEPLVQRSGVHDDRLLPQRFADALVELASGGKQAEVQVTASVETLKGTAGAPAGEMEFSLPISSSSVQRMACDCAVTRVLLSQESLVVDVGRSRRVISRTLRKALAVRDQSCRWPGCERSASYCDGHHLVHWVRGGPTDLDNLVLLCRRHHRMVHEGGWQLVRYEGGRVMPVAPTITFGLARGPD